MSKTAAIATYRRFPKELFRVNSGWRVNLRPRMVARPSAYYDIATTFEEGKRLRDTKVQAKVLEPGYERESLLLLVLQRRKARADDDLVKRRMGQR